MSFPHFDTIRTRPWNSRRFTLPGWTRTYPTMLTHEEMRMLAWVAEVTPGAGAVIDLGAFLGGSSASLALGAEKADPPKRVHSYDRFQLDEKVKFQFLYRKGHGLAEGEDGLPVFHRFTRAVADTIEVHPGDIQDADWDASPVAVLFIDISKTKDINDHLLATFFPALVPGSVIVQQDFLFFRNPWLYPTMQKLEASVEMLSFTDQNSVIFGVHRTPTAEELDACRAERTSYEETVAAIRHFRAKFSDVRQTEMIDALLASLQAAPRADKAWRMPNVAHLPALEDEN
jgi:predicted O-methyltransferase YrrM